MEPESLLPHCPAVRSQKDLKRAMVEGTKPVSFVLSIDMGTEFKTYLTLLYNEQAPCLQKPHVQFVALPMA